MQRATQASRTGSDDQNIGFELFALNAHSVCILADQTRKAWAALATSPSVVLR
jgi:hypothetical protein